MIKAGYLCALILAAGVLTVHDAARHGGRPPEPPPEATGTPARPSPLPPAPPSAAGAAPTAAPATATPAGPSPAGRTDFLSWALLDRRTGRITGTPNLAEPSDTMSLVKSWLAADHLRRAAERGELPPDADLRRLSVMIRDSDNAAAEAIYRRNGRDESIHRMIGQCGLTDSLATPAYWSNTSVSARDVARLGACIADGRAAGPWTDWLLGEMRQVRGTGDFGARSALPPAAAATVAIKNGWLLRATDRQWHVSCLAIGSDWSLGVLARYPAERGLTHGADLCRQAGAQLLTAR